MACGAISCLAAAVLLLTTPGGAAQRVRVQDELEAYPTDAVDLRCQFINGGSSTKLTQVSWIWEPTEGQRDNIAVFHPTYGESFPNPAFEGRVAFIQGTLENPSIRISNLKMADAGRYTCEYATYPSGNEQGTTNLVMLAKPRNSATAVTVAAGTKPVVVARCEAADGKPAAAIKWLATVGGTHTNSSAPGADGTVTVRSEYRLVPTPADNDREVTCMVSQRTQAQPWEFLVRLSVEYPPNVSIDGYDSNWYVGRLDGVLICQANGNPMPTITWTTMSGPLPDTVVVSGNRLMVPKVDYAVNTTFVCEVKNKLGVNRHQFTTIVTEEQKTTPSPSTGAVVGGILGAIALIGVIIGIVCFVTKRKEDEDAPPKHKPPPPVKVGSSMEMLNKPSVSPEVYYETSGGEPVTNLDDEAANAGRGALNGGTASLLDDSANFNNEVGDHGNDMEAGNREAPTAKISRGQSFVSTSMYV